MRWGAWSLVGFLVACAAPQHATAGKEGVEPVSQPSKTYLELTSRKVVGAVPGGLHLEGTMNGEVFVPQGDVLGEGPLGESGTPGWLELGSRQFMPDRTPRPPFPPYLKGYLTQGEFRPSTRTVSY